VSPSAQLLRGKHHRTRFSRGAIVIEHVRAIDEAARTQHGLVTSAQAVAALGPYRRRRWVTEGRLVLAQPSVYRLAGAPETWHQSLKALELSTSGIVSHRSAAEIWGLLWPAGYVEASIAQGHAAKVHPPAVAHRIKDLRPDLAVEREGLRLTDPVRTIVDLGLVVPHVIVAAALRRGISKRLVSLADARHIRDRLGRRGRNGTGVLGEVIDIHVLAGERAESELEVRFLELRKRFELTEITLQYEVWEMGRCVARVDGAVPRLKLAIEIDGYEHHTAPDAFQRDRTRQNELVALGWTVLRFTWDDIVHRPERVASEIRDAIGRLRAA
jgi:very-short-patch-repair endonuclease